VCFGCRSSNLILLNLTIALLLHLGTVTEVTEIRPLSAHFDRQARLVLVQLAEQLNVCAAGKAARLVHAVAYVAMRECTRRSRLV